jgi:hypothetical protein
MSIVPPFPELNRICVKVDLHRTKYRLPFSTCNITGLLSTPVSKQMESRVSEYKAKILNEEKNVSRLLTIAVKNCTDHTPINTIHCHRNCDFVTQKNTFQNNTPYGTITVRYVCACGT